jgi:hypothetical protein
MFWTGCGFAVLGCGRLFFAFEGILDAKSKDTNPIDRRTPSLERSEAIYVKVIGSSEVRTVGYDRIEGRLVGYNAVN